MEKIVKFNEWEFPVITKGIGANASYSCPDLARHIQQMSQSGAMTYLNRLTKKSKKAK